MAHGTGLFRTVFTNLFQTDSVKNRNRRFVLYCLSAAIIALFVLLWYTYLGLYIHASRLNLT